VVDPGRAARIFGLTQGGHFSEKVTYVYRKQLEEADLIVVNKCDASPPEILDRVVLSINETFPHAKTFVCSAKHGTNLEPWFKSLLSEEVPASRSLEINYDTYAEGEALLGWLNCTVRLETDQPFDGNRSLLALVDDIRNRVVNQGGRIAHLKATLDSHDGSGTLSVVSLVENNDEPDLRESLLDYVNGGSLVVNLRAEAEPVMLEMVTRDAITALSGIDATIEHLEQFKPGRPIPTHRMAL
jgi:G3E family GTPase